MIQAFPAQQGPQLASILTTVGLIEDLEFVVHGEAASAGFGHHLGIGRQQPGWGGRRYQRRRNTDPSGSLGLALLACGACTTENRFWLEVRLFML